MNVRVVIHMLLIVLLISCIIAVFKVISAIDEVKDAFKEKIASLQFPVDQGVDIAQVKDVQLQEKLGEAKDAFDQGEVDAGLASLQELNMLLIDRGLDDAVKSNQNLMRAVQEDDAMAMQQYADELVILLS